MTDEFVAPAEWPGAPDDLVRTQTGGRLHVPACPHLGSDVRAATEDERAHMEVCTWCRAELDGLGRRYFVDLAGAMREFGIHVHNQPRVREALKDVVFDKLWTPNSRSYVALGLDNRAVAWFGKTYAMPTPSDVVEFPDYAGGVRDGGTSLDEARGDLCGVHFVEKSLTGECEQCA